MIKREKDSKFVIYQVLYIFVITVLALKGADLDLRRVALEEETVDVSVKDSLAAILDSLYALGIDFSIKIDPKVLDENEEMRKQLAALNKKLDKVKDYVPPPEEEEPEIIVEEQTKLQLPISLKQTFIQYTWNTAKNSGTVPTTIYDPRDRSKPIVVIPPGQEKRFDLTDQTEVIIAFGSQEEKIRVGPNKPPEINIQRVTTKMNASDIYVRELQRITAFTVTILDSRPEQLKVSYSGPISVSGPQKDSDGNSVYNVSLRIAATENQFDDWVDKNEQLREADGRYKANFFFTVIDERTKDRVQVGDSFFFTEFSK
ncbi:MAG: hypothetical protein KJN64_09345 [Ignavibacteria bacterium]|nr:hypothetical protein [Ignavibacteria bacterium]MBT8382961.1 hypothetical protein [Ignavibacteria bacterium]MBT8391081.1 hypothetical protein [Ignavibacteria bacterium]NNJ54444.1 hypothetical protein [Ignavibacteriaceae bacterium]NNL19858.1 hypothetical protein [Ignavibacteriaceae bacterium]